MVWALFAVFHIAAVSFNQLVGDVFHYQEKNIIKMVQEDGYPIETHVVITGDGYILTLHRIPHDRFSDKATKGPIFLMHGLLLSSTDFVVLGEKSLAYTLVNAGYDVWLGNNRGNTYSHNHVSLSPILNNTEFFSFSYHEFGKYDLPAMIDYILQQTETKKIPYLGFSEGTTSFWVLMSERPEYNEKITIFNAWAPVTNMYKIRNPVINFLAQFQFLFTVARAIHWHELFPHERVGYLYRALCKLLDGICEIVFNLIGASYRRMPNKELKSRILLNFPAGMSLRQVQHYTQGARTGVFRPFDFGFEKNLAVYGKVLPDPYRLSAVTVPVVLYYGDRDTFINNDILLNNVAKQVRDVTTVPIPIKDFDHLDFIYSLEVDFLLEETLKNLEGFGAEKIS